MGATCSTIWNEIPPLIDFYPPCPASYTTLLNIFQYFPLFTLLQWIISWHPAGKTSLQSSIFNLPGRIAWCIMEIIGPINLIYNLSLSSPSFSELGVSKQLVASLYCFHYLNRAIISPFFSAPSMSPIHVFIMLSAMAFNWINSSCLSGWLRGLPVAIPGFQTDGSGALYSSTSSRLLLALPVIGAALFTIGMAGNIYSENSFFHLRRQEAEKQAKKSDSAESSIEFHKVYAIPPVKGVFSSILYPHYVFEWIEWSGFMLVGISVFPLGGFVQYAAVTPPLRPAPWVVPFVWAADFLAIPLPLPAVLFLINAIANMLPRARWGRRWYVEKFGEEAVAGRGAVVPWCSWM
ncbi:hypothetical protein N7495_000439 [Penicillium taxi]|uniref:uncharacterized protein n=1 Tax=Penicillium taxi TaxID=168475 RepID=UPI00254585FB|nr:uncharacterized protein N7495_000439 [Penicillium taxi]KAJ5907757.1 hypothetical protein N7495_000439 [Penicillium taxi]